MVRLYNIDENSNIITKDQIGMFKVLEHKMDYSSKTSKEAMSNYYLNRANVFKKQLLVTLNNESVCMNPGLMMYMTGNISIKTNVKGMGDFIGKAISSSLTKEGLIKPKYFGEGYIMLEPTYSYIILEKVTEGKGMVISDGTFLACSGDIKLKAIPVSSISSAALGKEGMFNLLLRGEGVLSFISPVPKEDITIVYMQNDILKVNGNYALAWTESLNFTVETSSSNLFGSTVSQEGYVNVYRGTGTVWLSSVLPN